MKAVLELDDMPENCAQCLFCRRLLVSRNISPHPGSYVCCEKLFREHSRENSIIVDIDIRQNWCRLKIKKEK